ncbi:hypothetical protein Ahy_A03g015784 isoform A [Arachis hypogaea]|uniref:Uncharacterized protein n=1 Tax=Arachis hypogaea TaxID=3818 RepID=A0A445E1G3_ARAHY|nr:hypothetical protein Ahy_A03g015784 isoform A [Arachis hypogaea]
MDQTEGKDTINAELSQPCKLAAILSESTFAGTEPAISAFHHRRNVGANLVTTNSQIATATTTSISQDINLGLKSFRHVDRISGLYHVQEKKQTSHCVSPPIHSLVSSSICGRRRRRRHPWRRERPSSSSSIVLSLRCIAPRWSCICSTMLPTGGVSRSLAVDRYTTTRVATPRRTLPCCLKSVCQNSLSD